MKKNLFGKALCALALGIFCLNSKGQNEQENLKKYWNYRDKYHKQFVKIGLGDGKSISAANIDNNPSNLSAEYGHNAWPTTNPSFGYRKWGDAMNMHGDYIAVLATQYKLLKDAGKDLTSVLNELYYAIEAVNRVDATAERKIGGPAYPNNQLNGFFVRDDVNSSFNQNWLGEFSNTEDTKDRYEGINSSLYDDRFPSPTLAQRSKMK